LASAGFYRTELTYMTTLKIIGLVVLGLIFAFGVFCMMRKDANPY
jgi:hypothetical protein